MKLRSITTLALLFVLSFSIIHEYAFTFNDENHCSVTEYISELSVPSSHCDICDIHFEYHQSFLLSQKTLLPDIEHISLSNIPHNESYNFKTHLKFFKPPIV